MKRHLKSSGWSATKRAEAKARCQANKPWEKSTGPITNDGKSTSSTNARKHGGYDARMMHLHDILYQQNLFLRKLMDMDKLGH